MNRLFYLSLTLLLFLMLTLTACGGQASSVNAAAPVGDPKLGKELFTTTCAICHGVDAQGLPGLGKNLVSSEFVGSQSDRDLVEFIKVGRAPDDPLNTTGVRMPPRGNNPALTDEDLYHIVAYIRSIRE